MDEMQPPGMMNPMAQQQAILSMGNDPQQYQLMQQQKMANLMRDQAMNPNGGRAGVQAGRVFVGQSPLNILTSALGAYQARQGQNAVNAGMAGIAQRDNAAKAAYLDRLQMGLRRNYPDQGTVLPPDGMEDR